MDTTSIILYPTETVYGLGVNVFDTEALGRLYELKGRDAAKAASWLVRDIAQMQEYAVLDEMAAKIATQFLPGPLTLVLRVRDTVPALRAAPDQTIGFRISSDPVAQKLIAESPHPLTCTSANASGMPALSTVSEILAQFGDRADMIDKVIDDGTRAGEPSTVVRVVDGHVDILREGTVPKRAILEAAGK